MDIKEMVYYGMYLVGFAIMMIVNLKTYKAYELTKKTAVIFTLITYVAGVTGAMIMGKVYSSLAEAYGASGSRVAIYGAVLFTPLFMITASLVFLKPWRKIMDLLAPGIFIILACAKFGCFVEGCCAGRECSFGVYNADLGLTVFPSQLFESITMFIVVSLCFLYAFKNKKCISGSVYPVTAIIYSVTRFLWEYMRYYPVEELRHAVFGMTLWQFCCLLTIVLSALWLVLLRLPAFIKAEEKYEAFSLKAGEKINALLIKRRKKNIVHHNKNKKKYQKKK